MSAILYSLDLKSVLKLVDDGYQGVCRAGKAHHAAVTGCVSCGWGIRK
jgi:hypothetical protein